MVNIPEQVKQLYRQGNVRKNYRIKVLDSNIAVITNDNLIKESVTINDKMCSGSKLKFGLCEGAILEFKAHGVADLTGRRLFVTNEIDCSSLDDDVDGVTYSNDLGINVYSVPMGFYTVESCIEDAVTGITKVTAYNKLNSDILDADITAETQARISAGTTVFALVYDYLKDFAIEEPSLKVREGNMSILDHDDVPVLLDIDGGAIEGKQGYVYMIGYELDLKYFRVGGQYEDFIKFMLNLDAIREFTSTEYDDYIAHGTGMTFKEYRNQDSRYQAVTLKYTTQDGTQITKKINIEDGDDFSSGWINAYSTEYVDASIDLILGCYYTGNYMSEYTADYIQYKNSLLQSFLDSDCYGAYIMDHTYIESRSINPSTQIESATAREMQSAIYEMDCLFGKLDRSTDLFSGVELNYGGLYPADTLYPASERYPNGAVESTFKSMYKNLYTNSQVVDTFKYLIITYKALDDDGNEVEKTLQRTVNTNGTVNYNMSSNWLFLNLVWTAREVGAYADEMVEKMRNISWFPFSVDMVGLPYLECGDMLEIRDRNGVHNSYILERNLDGIWSLEDTLENGNVYTF